MTIACGDNQFFCCKFWLIVTPACSISIIREELGQGGVYEGYKRGEKFGGKGSRLWFFLKSLVQYYILREIAAMVRSKVEVIGLCSHFRPWPFLGLDRL